MGDASLIIFESLSLTFVLLYLASLDTFLEGDRSGVRGRGLAWD